MAHRRLGEPMEWSVVGISFTCMLKVLRVMIKVNSYKSKFIPNHL